MPEGTPGRFPGEAGPLVRLTGFWTDLTLWAGRQREDDVQNPTEVNAGWDRTRDSLGGRDLATEA